MRKVLLVAPSYPFPEYKDGLAKINYNLIMRCKNVVFDLLTLDDSDQLIEGINEIKTFHIPLKQKLNKVHLISRWFLSNKPFNTLKYAGYYDKITRKLLELEKSYDVIHLSSPFFAPIIEYLPDRLCKKLILFPIDSLSLFTSRRLAEERNIFKKLAFWLDCRKCIAYESYYYELYRQVVFVSDKDADFIKKLNLKTTTLVIPNGVDTTFFSKNEAVIKENNSLIFTGDMAYAPNKDGALLLADIVNELKKTIPVRLFIVGQRPPSEVIALANDHIEVTGFVDDIRPYIDKSSIYVSPLRFGSGIKNKVLEAMSMSKLVVGTEISFDGIGATNNKNCIEVSCPDDFFSVIRSVFANKEISSPIESNAREYIEMHFSWENIVKRYEELYESCSSD